MGATVSSTATFFIFLSASGAVKNHISKHLSVGLNISYDFYDADYSNSWWTPVGGGGSTAFSARLGFLGIYLYPQLNFGKRLSFYVNVGPYLGLLSNYDVRGEGTDDSEKEDFRQNPVALMIGTGLQYAVNNKWQLVLDVNLKAGPVLIESADIKNQKDLIYSLGFFYQIGKKKTAPNN